jgi:transposase
VFICRHCGYHLNADLNAARNIAAKYHADGGRAAIGGLRVREPIVSNPLPLASGRVPSGCRKLSRLRDSC